MSVLSQIKTKQIHPLDYSLQLISRRHLYVCQSKRKTFDLNNAAHGESVNVFVQHSRRYDNESSAKFFYTSEIYLPVVLTEI